MFALHRLGLADRDDELTLYLIDKKNYGFGNMLPPSNNMTCP